MTQPTRSGRIPTKKVPWEGQTVLPPSAAVKKTKKSHVEVLETRAASPNAPPVIHELANALPVDFTPSIKVANECFKVLWKARDPLSLFLSFFGGFESLSVVCAATNAHAEFQVSTDDSALNSRGWTTLRPIELLHWLGVLFYMANHTEQNRKAYWERSELGSTHHLGEIMSEVRWDQIHRHLTFNPTPRHQNDTWFSRVEPVATTIRQNCQNAVKSSSWVAVDEAMAGYAGRTKHCVNLPSKPTPKGYKIWVLALKHGYIWSWRWHSRTDGPESIGKNSRLVHQPVPMVPVQLAPTYLVVQDLCQELQDKEFGVRHLVFLDNLFLTLALAHTLLQIGVGVMGTTRKNHKEFPKRFIDAKLSDTQFSYGSCATEVVNHALCFLWQDNAAVIGISTALTIQEVPQDYVVKLRKRPYNNAVAKGVFGEQPTKQLPIPRAIDYYNCHHNLVDLADQLRGNFSVQRRWETRTWRPLAYWLLDTCLTNSYITWITYQPEDVLRDRQSHRNFRQELISQIFALKEPSPSPPPTPARTRHHSKHTSEEMPRRGFCAWRGPNGDSCTSGVAVTRGIRREALVEVSGNARTNRVRKRSKLTKFGCKLCNVHLCRRKGCHEKFHAFVHSNQVVRGI
jgi:hypothetical protein